MGVKLLASLRCRIAPDGLPGCMEVAVNRVQPMQALRALIHIKVSSAIAATSGFCKTQSNGIS
jgi:hypothetical protein